MDKDIEEALVQSALLHFKVFQEFIKLTGGRSTYLYN